MNNALPQVLKPGGSDDRGETARLQYFVGAIAVGDLVKTTLGPKGCDKILQPMGGEGSHAEKIVVTNDGATILKSVWLDNPAAKILVDVAKQQDKQCGDGTTGVVVLTAELLRNAEQLVEKKIHPQVIRQWYHAAAEIARKALDEMSCSIQENEKELKEMLISVARTTLSSKLLSHDKEHFAKLAVDAVLRLKGKPNIENIQILKISGGTLRDSYLDEGFVLRKSISVGHPKRLTDCKVLVANTSMDTDKIKIYGAKVNADSFETVKELEAAEKLKMEDKVKKIAQHGCNVFINRQLIYNYPEQLFRNHGILAIEHADFDGTERLAAVLGADIVSTFDNPQKTKFGYCKLIEEAFIGNQKVIRFSGCKENEACSVILRGSNLHILEEAERSLHDALAVIFQLVRDTRIVYGAGAPEMWMARRIDESAAKLAGKKKIVLEAYASALRQVVAILASNAGLDSIDIVTALTREHLEGKLNFGIDVENKSIGDAKEMGVLESYSCKQHQVISATEAAEMIVRVDGIIHCAPRKREGM